MTNFNIPEDFKYSISNIGLSNNRILYITFSDKYDNKEISLHFDLKDISNPLDILKKILKKTIQDITIKEIPNIENIIFSNIAKFCNNKKGIKFVKRSKDNSDYICEDLNCNKNYQSNEYALNKNNSQNNSSNSNDIPTDINDEMDKFLIYRIPISRNPENENNHPSDFVIGIKDISAKGKENLLSFPKRDHAAIVKEAVSLLFANLRPKEKEYFNKNVRHLLKVRCI